MPKFFVKQEQIYRNEIYIKGQDVNHIKKVLRAQIGDNLEICDSINQINYDCKIEEFKDDSIRCKILKILNDKVESNIEVTIYQGLPKADKMELIIQKSVELGAFEIIPVRTKRCIVKLDKKFDTLQTQKLSTLYDIDGKVLPEEDEEDDEEEEQPRKNKKKKGFIAFMKNHVILSFVCIGILLFAVALGGTILFMNLTKSKDAQIPNLVKNENGERYTEQQAVAIYNETEFKKKNDLKIEYVEEETYNGETVEPGYVVRQDPEYVPNRTKKIKDQITIYVRKEREAKTLTMIDLTGKTQEEVESLMETLGYVGTITYEKASSEDLKAGLVIDQSIKNGEEFKDDAELVVTISTGSSKVDVPNTLGKTEAAARTELETAGFKVTVEETENTDKSDGIVLKQSITGKADPGTTITITVNKITKPTEATVTIDVSKYVSQTTEDDNTNETDNTTNSTPTVKRVRVTLELGEDVVFDETRTATEVIPVTVTGKGNMTLKLKIDGVLKATKNIDFNTQTSLAFP